MEMLSRINDEYNDNEDSIQSFKRNFGIYLISQSILILIQIGILQMYELTHDS